ncbi:PD-(D/E)XK nuclease family protein [Limisalsivibrio acetivorans]|uniref:PD-(D/E)XK nuclease family protein n=1 Tax=Limisalsivibrio acetivorans TaxID=1304888 RepID=UPI0003B68EBA|nr:PD-(D/E)XK nuclease family protein [Limisalsivibrio acetivorans]
MIYADRIPQDASPIGHTANYIKRNSLTGRDCMCILPTGRNTRSLANRLSSSKDSPDIYNISDFYRYLFKIPAPLVPSELRSYYLRKAAQRLKADEQTALFKKEEPSFMDDFISFTGTGTTFHRFFRELSAEHITPEDLRKASLYTDYERETELLHVLLGHYRDILGENGLCDDMDIHENPVVDERWLSRYKKAVILISGYLTRHENRTLAELGNQLELHIIFNFSGSKTWNHKETEQALAIEIPERDQVPLPPVTLSSAPTAAEEYERVIAAVYSYMESGTEPEKIAVLLPDESMKEMYLQHDPYNLFNVSAGMDAISFEPLQIAETIAEALEKSTERGLPIESAMKIIRQPACSKLFGSIGIEQRVLKRMENGALFVSAKDLTAVPAVNDTIGIYFAEDEAELSMAAYMMITSIKAFKKILDSDREIQHANTVITELQRLRIIYSAANDTFPLYVCIRQILTSLSGVRFHHPGGPVTVMGLLESRNMKFDAVIVPGMNADTFPPVSEKDLYLNTELRQNLKLPTFMDREHLAINYLDQILQRSKSAQLIYREQGDAHFPSPYIEKLRTSRKLETIQSPYGGALLFGKKGRRGYEDIDTLPPVKDIKERLKRKKISATMLQDYLDCTFRFCLKYLYGLRTPPEPLHKIPAYEYGNALHTLLEHIFKDDIDYSPEELHKLIKEGFLKSMARFDAYSASPVEQFKSEMTAEGLVSFARNEAERRREGWRTIEFEEKYEEELFGFPFKGIIDRIDQSADHTIIVDYKFSKKDENSKGFDPENPKEIQMPLYALLYEKRHGKLPDGVFWYELKNKYNLVKAFDMADIELFKGFIETVIGRMTDAQQEFTKTEKTSRCQYCDYADICARSRN